MISKLINLLYKSMFLCEDEPYKHAGIFPTSSWILTSVILMIENSYLPLLFMEILLIALLTIGIKTFAYALAIAFIPSLWLALTSIFFLGLRNMLLIVEILLKVLIISLLIITYINLQHPAELSFVLNKFLKFLGTKKEHTLALIAPLLLFRVLPYVMRDGLTTLEVSKLKKEKPWKSLAILILHAQEKSEGIEEALWNKLVKVRGINYFYYDLRYVSLFLTISLINTILLLIY